MRSAPLPRGFAVLPHRPHVGGCGGVPVALVPVVLSPQLTALGRHSTSLVHTALAAPRTSATASQEWRAQQMRWALTPLVATRMHVRAAPSPAHNRLPSNDRSTLAAWSLDR
jgi:hypothetical protein